MTFPFVSEIAEKTPSKILLLVADGLGGLMNESGKSELQTARKPNLDALASESALGLTYPVAPGVTAGSGAGHLGLFGYDPTKYLIKRGIMEALGVTDEVRPGSVCARGNFCTIDASGTVIDRRAGRIPTAESAPLAKLLQENVRLKGAKVTVLAGEDHRFAPIFEGEGLSDEIGESDPGHDGQKPLLPVKALSPAGEKMARIATEFSLQAKEILKGRAKANMVLMRGFSAPPEVPSMEQVYKLNACAIAAYPMYRGLSQIVGMQVLKTGHTFTDELETLKANWEKYDFFFIHYKPADSAGEDGDFQKKVRMIEQLDSYIPAIRALKPDVLMVCGDHSTPAVLKSHSWHPVPFLLNGAYAGRDGIAAFDERSCGQGSLGRFPAKDVMMLAMANALKLKKFGA